MFPNYVMDCHCKQQQKWKKKKSDYVAVFFISHVRCLQTTNTKNEEEEMKNDKKGGPPKHV